MIPHILIFDNDKDLKPNFTNLIIESGFTSEQVTTESEFWERLKVERFQIILFDPLIIKPSGEAFLDNIKKSHPDLLVILTSHESNWKQVAHLLREHRAYDLVTKPIDSGLFKISIERAFDYLEVRNKAETVLQGESLLYKNMIEIFNWKNSISNKGTENIAGDLIHQMNISLFQGSGIGTLMSIVSVLMSKAKLDESESNYIVPKNIFALLGENYDAAQGMFDSMSISQSVIEDSNFVETQESPNILNDIVENEIKALHGALEIKNQRIKQSSMPIGISKHQIVLSVEKMRKAIREILVNALKYSRENDQIFILYFLKDNFFELKVINPAYTNDDGTIGISGKQEQLVFEPFYRLSSVMNDNYVKYEYFRFGLGLPLAKKIVEQHKANIEIYTIDNNIRDQRAKDICLTIRFPLKQKA